MMKIDSVEVAPNGTVYIRVGKTEYEIAGGLERAKRWIEHQTTETHESQTAVALEEYLKNNPEIR